MSDETFYDRLHRSELDERKAVERSEALSSQIDALDERLAGDLADIETTERARARVRERVSRRFARWSMAYRSLERSEYRLPPGEAADVRTLLRHAEVRALRMQGDELGVLGDIDRQHRRVEGLVGNRAHATIDLAQSRAASAAAGAERMVILELVQDEKNREKVDEELEAADQSLARSLSMLVKNETNRDFHKLKGTLLPPVSSEPDHEFGRRKQRGSMSYVRHTGLTWDISRGTSVRAVASGLIVYASEFEGFGKLVIIDHGSGYHSLYAHLDSVDVETGKRVDRGDEFAESGATGSFEGAKLYFELRHDGSPINPAPWFIQKDE